MGINGRQAKPRSFKVAGLFAGIGGIELGLSKAGHTTTLLCENDTPARAVLARRFPGLPLVEDVRALDKLPKGTNMLAAGFPCQDLSQAGGTRGLKGERSGLVFEVLRLLESHELPWVLLENVPFMLRLGRGAAMAVIIDRLEQLGYRWAYRVMDTRSFGLPQRRERVYLLASRTEDPGDVLFKGDFPLSAKEDHTGKACGFYWTEGKRGLGWAVGAIPTLKGGSSLGIASPPSIWLPSGRIVTPDIRDAERLQGFRADWTKPAEEVGRAGFRWKLVGNAVSVPVAQWIGERLARPTAPLPWRALATEHKGPWPKAAFGGPEGRFSVALSTSPVNRKRPAIDDFLRYPPKDLSLRATRGFVKRFSASTLRAPDEFRVALDEHIDRMVAVSL